jgi:hypothetical protein
MIKTHANHKAEIALPLSEMTNIEITLINFHLPVKILRTNLAVLSPVSLNTTVFFSGFVLPDCQHLRTLSIILSVSKLYSLGFQDAFQDTFS